MMTKATKSQKRSKPGSRKSGKKPGQGAPQRRSRAATTAAKKTASGRNTKLARLEAALRSPEGATIAALSKALDWQPHSVRGAISGALKKKQGLKVTSTPVEGGDRTYRITG